ncbi:hypothetical protein BV898_01383 [Hypsibius exemplaris]|uniref:Cyclic nucleotide-binding domain-containing protein n=1 Tax=Hypsibius exemplaris TaxID=2072580 RepID=A0A1W0XC04_HYPEX|nr:hypothetical protein BV898_01383 [Hypsibius exemplaris]
MAQVLDLPALRLDPCDRDDEDLERLFAFLRSFRVLADVRDSAIRSICRFARYEYHEAEEVLFGCGEEISCWYILLSGSTFINGMMYLPGHW